MCVFEFVSHSSLLSHVLLCLYVYAHRIRLHVSCLMVLEDRFECSGHPNEKWADVIQKDRLPAHLVTAVVETFCSVLLILKLYAGVPHPSVTSLPCRTGGSTDIGYHPPSYPIYYSLRPCVFPCRCKRQHHGYWFSLLFHNSPYRLWQLPLLFHPYMGHNKKLNIIYLALAGQWSDLAGVYIIGIH